MNTLNGYQVRYPLQPGEVPVFEAADMCRFIPSIGARHCAADWCDVLGLDRVAFVKAYTGKKKIRPHSVTRLNDRLPSDAARADAMNRTMRAMGIKQVDAATLAAREER